MSLHVIQFQLVRDLGNHWNLIQSILTAHNEISPYTIFQYLFWFQIVVITRVHKNIKKLLLASSYLSVGPSVRIEQLGSNLLKYYEILCLKIFWKYAGKIWVSLKSNNNNGYFTK
jgi:hypothetical protein